MDNFLKDLKFHVYDRLRSPLVGAFLISWMSWNFSTVILVFGKGDFDKKILMLSKIYPTNVSYVWHGLICPLASATAFILIYPFIARWTFLYWIGQLKTTKKKQADIEDEIPLPLEDVQELKKSFYERSRNQEIEIDRLHKINQQLKLDIKEYENLYNKILDEQTTKDRELTKVNAEFNKSKVELAEKNKIIDELEKKTAGLNSSKLKALKESLNTKSEEAELQKFLDDIGWQDKLVADYLRSPLVKIKNFKNKNNLNVDELKTIIYTLSKKGKAPIDELGNFLDLSDINVEIIINRLVKNKWCFLNDQLELELTQSTNNLLYEDEITKIKGSLLSEIVSNIHLGL